jgi:UDP-sulfoquinovose synthase
LEKAMKILILGIDGYLGWPLALHLADRNHKVSGLDNGMRRSWVRRMGSASAIPIAPVPDRLSAFNIKFGYLPRFETISIEDYPALCLLIESEQPDTIVHLAQCPSSPYSMVGPHEAAFVMRNNVIGTLYLLHAIRDNAPNAHLVKLGSMGEYGTPDVDITEDNFHFDFRGRTAVNMPFPRKAGSWYEWSQVHDTMDIMWACEAWGLRATDIKGGITYGSWIDAMAPTKATGFSTGSFRTRHDIDEAFGTIINRFCAQAVIGHPLTIYGEKGKQERAYSPIHDTMECLTLAIENPPDPSTHRMFSQFAEVYSVLQIAEMVATEGFKHGLDVRIGHFEAPRTEKQEHYYAPDLKALYDLGYVPDDDTETNISLVIESLLPYRERIKKHSGVLRPQIRWDGNKDKVRLLGERLTDAGVRSEFGLDIE